MILSENSLDISTVITSTVTTNTANMYTSYIEYATANSLTTNSLAIEGIEAGDKPTFCINSNSTIQIEDFVISSSQLAKLLRFLEAQHMSVHPEEYI